MDPASEEAQRRSRSTLLAICCAVFVAVFLLVLLSSVIVSFIMPESFASTARIKLDMDGTYVWSGGSGQQPTIAPPSDRNLMPAECGVIQSSAVLDRVIDPLNLNNAWGTKYHLDGPLRTPETSRILQRMVTVRPVPNTRLIDIEAFSDSPQEAASLANEVAKAYRAYRFEERKQKLADIENSKSRSDTKATASATAWRNIGPLVSIIEQAQPSYRPARPNKLLNAVRGAAVGIVLGAIAAGLVALVSLLFKRSPSRTIRQPEPAAQS